MTADALMLSHAALMFPCSSKQLSVLPCSASVVRQQQQVYTGQASVINAGLDLENDATAANKHTVPEQGSSKVSTFGKAKISMLEAQHAAVIGPKHLAMHTSHQTPPRSQQQTQQQQQQQQQQQHADSGTRQVTATLQAAQHGRTPKGWSMPSQLLLPRAGIFYCSSFPASCGLPKHSELPCLFLHFTT